MEIVKKLVLPVAGMGTRLYPLTVNTPKALVQVRDKPLLDYIVEEAVASGIRDILLVMSPQHREHFKKYLKDRRTKFNTVRFVLRPQEHAHGNGQAILRVARELGGEPFAVRFCDDLLFDREPALHSLVRLFRLHQKSVFVLERVPRSRIHEYGVVAVERRIAPSLYSLRAVVEKPKADEAHNLRDASNLAIIGAYVLTPKIVHHLMSAARVAPPISDALPLTVAFHRELAVGGTLYGWEFPGRRIDCGTLEGLKKAHVFLGRTRF